MPRIALAGDLTHLPPLILAFSDDATLDLSDYSGYNRYAVMCIGAGGGRGGGIDTGDTGTHIKSYGGAGGGGGAHQVSGLRQFLPTLVDIICGHAGADGTDAVSNPALTTDGANGGYSSFNGTTCRASGGKGGKRVQSNLTTVTTQANGGQGGIGDSIAAGGGAAGGTAGTPADPGPGVAGADAIAGSWDGTIGSGGGGGAGGVGKYGSPGTLLNPATSGGHGSYDLEDSSVYGPGGDPSTDTDIGQDIIPGIGGGAKASVISGAPSVYGSSGMDGIVILQLFYIPIFPIS